MSRSLKHLSHRKRDLCRDLCATLLYGMTNDGAVTTRGHLQAIAVFLKHDNPRNLCAELWLTQMIAFEVIGDVQSARECGGKAVAHTTYTPAIRDTYAGIRYDTFAGLAQHGPPEWHQRMIFLAHCARDELAARRETRA